MVQPSQMRASDEDRDRIAGVLRDAHAEGRLTQDELVERLDSTYTARTYQELDRLVADLPLAGSQSTLARVRQHGGQWLDEWLASHEVCVNDVRSWAIHPGGPRILKCVEQPLGLDEQATRASREVLRDHGNMSSPTVLFILKRLRETRAPRPCVALGFGPGLAAEVALFT